MKQLLKKLFSWFPLYRSAIGGYWFYNLMESHRYKPEQFFFYGNNIKIGDNVEIHRPERMKIGDGVLIEPYCHIRAGGGVSIGNYSGFGQYCTVLTTDHRSDGNALPFDDISIVMPVVIEDHVWVGSHVAILGGVTIGEGAIIGLGSVVRRDIPPLAIAMGNPARVIGYRDKDHYNKLKSDGASLAPRPSLGGFVIYEDMHEKYSDLLNELGIDATTIKKPSSENQ